MPSPSRSKLPPDLMHAFSTFSTAAIAHHAVQEAGVIALRRLLPCAHGTSTQAEVLARFLLSLYAGHRFPFDLSELSFLAPDLFVDCLAVVKMSYRPELPLYAYFKNGQQIWEQLAEEWRFSDHRDRSWR